MWPFKKSAFLPAYEIEWHFATYAWLLKNFGGYEHFSSSELILPTPEFFPENELTGHEKAQNIFDQVKEYCGLSEWPTQLEAQEERAEFLEVQPGFALAGGEQSPGGTFSFPKAEGEAAVISYKPSLANQPIELVATFAHELGHYLTATAADDPPGGWEAWEIATDLTAVFLGFGTFSANSAFNFSQFGDGFSGGWSTQRNGYLSETSLLFALAIFVELTGTEPEAPIPHLKPNLISVFHQAVLEVRKHSSNIKHLKLIEAAR